MERSNIRRLIRECSGNLTAIARKMEPPMTRQGIAWHLRRHDLLDEAARARVLSGQKGPRMLSSGEVAGNPNERAQIIKAISISASHDQASAQLGISKRTLYRRMHQYKLI